MQVLAFRHVPFEDVGLIRPILEERGIAIEYADLYRPGSQPPDTKAFDALIFMGGPMSVRDPLPFLQWEMRAILEAVQRNQPVLGICLGSQLIAKALGARVYSNPGKEIGWFDVSFNEEARSDPLFAGVLRTNSIFHWHGETFDLPDGATLLASSERCRHQAFRVGDRTYGLQFHLEVTPEMISAWCTEDANSEDVRELDAPIDAWRNSADVRKLAQTVFGRWCDVIATAHCKHIVA
jgi:GMP synthase (glutamine-hydrolysing)